MNTASLIGKLLLFSLMGCYFVGSFSKAVAASSSIIINEIYYNVENDKGGDPNGEWVELYNSGNFDVDLQNWTLADNSATRTISTLSFVLHSGDYCLISRSKEIWPLWNINPAQSPSSLHFIELNSKIGNGLSNSGDDVVIKDNSGQIIDQVSWGSNKTYFELAKSAKGASLSRVPNGLDRDSAEDFIASAKPTPGITNPSLTRKSNKAGNKFAYLLDFDLPVSLNLVRSFPLDQEVFVRGKVIMPPDILSQNSFYITDDTAAIQIYSHNKDFPILKPGDIITVNGLTAESNNEKRIKIQSSRDIEILSSGHQLSPMEIKIEEIKEDNEGQYVKVRGEIAETSGDTFSIMNGGQIKTIIRKLSGIDKPAMRRGDKVEIAGVVSQYRGEYRILPFRQEDVKIINPLPVKLVEIPEDDNQEITLPITGLPEKFYLFTTLILGGLWNILLAAKKKLTN